jgi:glycosyltransferase involved in cell wall biosynthesis
MQIAILLPSLKTKGPVVLAFDIIKSIINKIEKIDVFYFTECSNPYFLEGLDNVNYIKISFYKPFSFNDYDIVHSHSFKPDFYTFIFKNKISSRVITTVHNYVYEELLYTYNIFISEFFSRIWISSWGNKDLVVFLSNDMKKYYMTKNLTNKNSIVIYNGRSVNKLKSDNEHNEIHNLINEIKKKYKIIGGCGFLNKRKGFEDIIKFLTLNSNLAAVLIGQGPDEDKLINLAKNLDVLDRCFFLGHLNNPISIINLLDVYVMSSYSEGFPLVVLEAGSLGVPIICVNSPLFNELFSDSDVVFYERNNLISMELALNKILNKNHLYSKNIINTINTKYSCKIMSDKYLQNYILLNSN